MPDANGWLSDSEQEAIWDGWSEIYRAQDEALIENGEAWRCQECGHLCKEHDATCPECGYAPSAWLCSCGAYIEEACHCSNCGQQAPWGCDCGLRDDIELQGENDAFIYDPEEYGTDNHYYRGLDKPSGDDGWWLDSQEDDDEPTEAGTWSDALARWKYEQKVSRQEEDEDEP